MKFVGLGDNLKVSEISACKQILLNILEEKEYSCLKECEFDLMGSVLFRAIPVKLRNCILFEYFYLGGYYDTIYRKYLKETNLSLEEISKVVPTDPFPVYSYCNIKYSCKREDLCIEDLLNKDLCIEGEDLEYLYLYLFELNESLNEEKLAFKYLMKLRESGEISYNDSLDLLPKIQMDYLLSSEFHPFDIYKYYYAKEEGEIYMK
ncbi:hypothetical protein NGRA_1813 [Nosema granulosis]|uniref:Uncharacterized protein n=1 Tax=Nosema granulosis TaxID=83296 RepID=A0A9P6GYT8_9MICR|nr:hypothetical protein NGRA_1813 [Nosema granulosis]